MKEIITKYKVELDRPKTRVLFDTLEEAEQWYNNVHNLDLRIEEIKGHYENARQSSGFLIDNITKIFVEEV